MRADGCLLHKQGPGSKLLSLAGTHRLAVNSTVLFWLASTLQDASAVEGSRPNHYGYKLVLMASGTGLDA